MELLELVPFEYTENIVINFEWNIRGQTHLADGVLF